ncbi:Spc98 family-domain-containing protein [Fomes fomentarius]|nr:Spc98 family-domain-containing protein [Fomes fomentarius]
MSPTTNLTLEPVEDMEPTICALPEIPPQFFIPRLEDKPQNPIMDTLGMYNHPYEQQSKPPAHRLSLLPPELNLLSESISKFEQEKRAQHFEMLWEQAVSRRSGKLNQVLSWDALRSSYNANVSPSPFLSEQTSDTFASARYHVRPPIQAPDVKLVYVQVTELFASLLLTVSGTSSQLHIWDAVQQKFVLRNLQGKERGKVVIVGKDEVVSASLVQRFLTIGNLIRRLELLTDIRGERHASRRPTPILHAFTHALSSILAYLRQNAATIPPDLLATGADACLAALWTRYEDTEQMLRALAALCGRGEHIEPSAFLPLPSTPTSLLSLIYKHLEDHIERSSRRIVTGILAYMLTTTSRGYIVALCVSVGYNTPGSQARPLPPTKDRTHSDSTERLYAGDEGNGETNAYQRDAEADEFPEFVRPEVAEVFSRARKSLVLLRAADPKHPLLTSECLHLDIEWLWTEEQLENMEDGIRFGGQPVHDERRYTHEQDHESSPSSSDVMHAFKVFDLFPGEPSSGISTGSLANASGSILSGAHSTVVLRAFLTSFPLTLPPSTPTLAHLTARVLSPLVDHAQALSGALVARFLAPDTRLHLPTHLALLRGYILITAHTFKARLQEALFNDAEEVSVPVVGSRTYAVSESRGHERERAKSRSRSRASQAGKPEEKEKVVKSRRAIGLSPALMIGDKWPPLGSDLNFFLRTVVVDALEEGRFKRVDDDEESAAAKAQRQVVEEAEWRLGFAIRDLPMGTGREKWLNPLSIEALDFLYMHYQPPHPLDVIITPVILSKYHRMFAFNLRLLRVENVVRTLFRLTRNTRAPLFPTLTASNKLLLYFRFIAHSFVMALSSYVYDVAIGSNMDSFLARLTAASSSGLSTSTNTATSDPRPTRDKSAVFEDVFSLADHHSKVLDDILSSCLLRSGQKAVGDILRGCTELVLELGVLAGEIKDGNLEEYEAAPMLDELWGRFRAKMTTFVKVLKALVEKEADASGLVLSDIPFHMMQGHRRIPGTTANLHQLLLRLNMSNWWTRKDTSTRST